MAALEVVLSNMKNKDTIIKSVIVNIMQHFPESTGGMQDMLRCN